MSDEVEVSIVTLKFDAADPEALAAVLSRYVVVARGHDGCRNIDFCASATTQNRMLLIQKWDSPDAQRRHFDSEDMVEMATACRGLLTGPPEIELFDAVSAHDLT